MSGPYHGWLYAQGADGRVYEIINQARLAAYLKSPTLALPSGFSVCDVLDFGGCEAYAYSPPCDGDPGFIDFPGVVGNYVSTPDAALFDIVDDLTLIADVAMDDWTPATTQTFISKWNTAGNLSYAFSITTGGFLMFRWTTNGSTILQATSTVPLAALGNGERRSLRVDLDVAATGGTRRITFYTAIARDKAYVQLGAIVSQAGTTSMFSGSSPVFLGSLTTASEPFGGRMFFAEIRNGISGTTAVGGSSALTVDGDALTSPTAQSFFAVGGQAMTINETGSPGIFLGLGPSQWQPQFYQTPALDPAPWYDAARPESAGALGFFVEEWSGLDASHVTRPVAQSGTYRSRVGTIAAKERVMKLNVLLMGTSEQSVDYLFHWLNTTLSNACSTCATDTMYIRRFCPSGIDKGEGVGELREVGYSEGLTWEDDPVTAGKKCYLRRASFSLVAGDPCIYVNGTTAAVEVQIENIANCMANLKITQLRLPCRPVCDEMVDTCRNVFTYEANPLGSAGPVVRMVNDNNDWSMPCRAITYFNANDLPISGANFCGMPQLGELYVSPLPPWSELVWDVPGRNVLYWDHTTGAYVNGWAFVDANDRPLPRYFSVPCGTGHVVIEPGYACLHVVNGLWYALNTPIGTSPHLPTTTVTVQERLGCP